jgi:hypothetical protein
MIKNKKKVIKLIYLVKTKDKYKYKCFILHVLIYFMLETNLRC